LGDDVQVARRETTLYGGLNVRLSPAKAQRIEPYTDPPGASPRRAWAQRTGVPPGGSSIIGLTILQHPSNPYYPGDWVQYPELFWIQPTFPASGTRHTIGKDRPLVLRYRLWIHKRKLGPEKLKRLWDEYARVGSLNFGQRLLNSSLSPDDLIHGLSRPEAFSPAEDGVRIGRLYPGSLTFL
jgi:hypothetical protein